MPNNLFLLCTPNYLCFVHAKGICVSCLANKPVFCARQIYTDLSQDQLVRVGPLAAIAFYKQHWVIKAYSLPERSIRNYQPGLLQSGHNLRLHSEHFLKNCKEIRIARLIKTT